ncbi:MAG: CotH kinase family protein, partial [Clostridia bacterium]|nr:CotH kinase family protein [Clostridia bacterium]
MFRRMLALFLATALLAALLPSCAKETENAGPLPDPTSETAAQETEPIESTAKGTARFASGTEIFNLRTARTRAAAEDFGLTLTFNGTPLPHAGKIWYLPVTEDFSAQTLVLLNASAASAESESGEEAAVTDILLDEHLRDAGILPYLRHNNPTEVIVLTAGEYISCDLVFTTLPILSFDPAKKHLNREDTAADFAIWEPRTAGPNYLASASVIKVRGASSSSLAKVPYKFSLLDSAGEPKNVGLCGMRRDDDWILYASYSDNTHVRDMVGWRLWRRMTETSDALTAAPLGAEYVELIIGGKYEG